MNKRRSGRMSPEIVTHILATRRMVRERLQILLLLLFVGVSFTGKCYMKTISVGA